jgi:putative transcriptional regulator
MSTFERIMAGLNEALEHAKGNEVPGMRVYVPDELDVAAIRKRTGLSQPAFASTIGVKHGTLKNWEQRRRQPEGPARVLLAMLDRNPKVVVELLGTHDAPPEVPAEVIAGRGADRLTRGSGARTLAKKGATKKGSRLGAKGPGLRIAMREGDLERDAWQQMGRRLGYFDHNEGDRDGEPLRRTG